MIIVPLPRPKLIRIIAAPDGEAWRTRVGEALQALDEPVALDTGSPGEHIARAPAAAILIWSKETGDSASVFREIGECDRRHVGLYILDAGESPVLGAIENLAVSTYVYIDDTEMRDWLSTT